jgi:hypothetical protein
MQADPPALWQIQRRAHGRMLIWAIVLGIVLATVSALMIQMLMLQPDPIIAGVVGGLLGLALVGTLYQGAGVRVEHDARLIYSLRGHPSVVVDLRRVSGFHFVKTGVLSGIAVECPLEALTFLSRKGVTRRQCEACAQHLGAPLVLEFLSREDLDPLLSAWQRSLTEHSKAAKRSDSGAI